MHGPNRIPFVLAAASNRGMRSLMDISCVFGSALSRIFLFFTVSCFCLIPLTRGHRTTPMQAVESESNSIHTSKSPSSQRDEISGSLCVRTPSSFCTVRQPLSTVIVVFPLSPINHIFVFDCPFYRKAKFWCKSSAGKDKVALASLAG